jgi:hypothetical protein
MIPEKIKQAEIVAFKREIVENADPHASGVSAANDR